MGDSAGNDLSLPTGGLPEAIHLYMAATKMVALLVNLLLWQIHLRIGHVSSAGELQDNSPHDWRRASLARKLVMATFVATRPAIHLQVGKANFVGLATRR